MLILTHFWLLYIEMILEKNIKTLWKINKQDNPRPPVCIHNSFFDRICRILTWALSLVLSLTSIRLKELWFTFYKEIEAQTCVKLGWEQGLTDPLWRLVSPLCPSWEKLKFGKFLKLSHKNAIKLKNTPTQFNVWAQTIL